MDDPIFYDCQNCDVVFVIECEALRFADYCDLLGFRAG
jgi:hypothetical protein